MRHASLPGGPWRVPGAVLSLSLVVALTACTGADGPPPMPATTSQPTADAGTPVTASGTNGAFGRDDPEAGPACFLATDVESLERLWALGDAGMSEPAPDLPRDLVPPVAGVFLGLRPEQGHAVAVVTVTADGDTAEVEVVTRRPSGTADQALTSPYVLVALPTHIREARTLGELTLDCVARVPEAPAPGLGEVDGG